LSSAAEHLLMPSGSAGLLSSHRPETLFRASMVRSDPPEPLSADRLAGPGKFIAFDATKIEHSPSSACPPVSWRLVLSTEHRTGT
jgi:hypothetical protein